MGIACCGDQGPGGRKDIPAEGQPGLKGCQILNPVMRISPQEGPRHRVSFPAAEEA